MKGYPKAWNTKKDAEISVQFWPDDAKRDLQAMLDNKDEWLIDRKLDDGETGVEDSTHKVVEVTDDDGTVIERYQYYYAEDPNGIIYRLGFSGPDEVQSLIDSA